MKIVWITFMLLSTLNLKGMDIIMLKNDTILQDSINKSTKLFYDSLHVKAQRHRVTKWLYDYMIHTTNDTANGALQSYEYYNRYKNKTIGSITIQSLEVFGPDFSDTTRTAHLWIERTANKMHSKSNPNVIRKNVWLKEGSALDPNLVMDNERFLRSLPYLKDVRFILQPGMDDNNIVDILILTKDVFSFGLSGSIGNINKGEIGISDKNVLGTGHEIGLTVFGHTVKKPHLGIETFYAINNVNGNFIDFTTGYANNYIRKGYFISLNHEFLRPQTVYAGGLSAFRSFRSFNTNINTNVTIDSTLNYLLLDGWYGRKLNVGIKSNDSRFQMTLAGRIRYLSFYDRPLPDADNKQFFANSTMYLAGLSFSQRSYIRDYRVYSYGIVEDIPKGYLHELVVGYDQNESGNRWYSHAFFSTGNLFNSKPYYFYTSLGIGGFWRHAGVEQGMVDAKINFISPLFRIWNVEARQFIKLNYTLGINRFEIENLYLRNNVGIRGFFSSLEKGKQRLTLNVENVFFQKRSILNFQTALFYYLDVGIVGPATQSIFAQDYFAGVGIGMRIRNENLIFKTLQIRLSFYPNHPGDVSLVGFILDEVPRTQFYNFQPRGPEPFRFE